MDLIMVAVLFGCYVLVGRFVHWCRHQVEKT